MRSVPAEASATAISLRSDTLHRNAAQPCLGMGWRSSAEGIETGAAGGSADAVYDYEPGEGEILEALLPRALTIQIFRALLENAASEQGARMSAMDNATRNAGDMIQRLSIAYNRQRQAAITTELVEIISGAEAL